MTRHPNLILWRLGFWQEDIWHGYTVLVWPHWVPLWFRAALSKICCGWCGARYSATEPQEGRLGICVNCYIVGFK